MARATSRRRRAAWPDGLQLIVQALHTAVEDAVSPRTQRQDMIRLGVPLATARHSHRGVESLAPPPTRSMNWRGKQKNPGAGRW